MSAEMLRVVQSLPVRACADSIEWIGSLPSTRSAADTWAQCQRGDWLLWLAGHATIDRRKIVIAACACARLALPRVPAGEARPLRAIETAEAWAHGESTIDGVRRGASYAAGAAGAAAAGAREASLAESARLVRSIISWDDIMGGLQ